MKSVIYRLKSPQGSWIDVEVMVTIIGTEVRVSVPLAIQYANNMPIATYRPSTPEDDEKEPRQ